MSFRSVTLVPGINVEFTPALNRAGWSASNLMRFRLGLPEKVGGWLAYCQTPVVGTGTGMKSWAGLDGTPYLMVGSDQRLAVVTGGILYDITPLRLTHNVAVSFTTNSGSAVVRIVDAASAGVIGDWVYIVVPVSVGGLVLQGFYLITNAINANTYEITAPALATANVVTGGAVPLFTTTNTSATVQVTLNNHGLATGSTFVIEVATTVGGIVLAAGVYSVTLVNANNFTIQGGTVATSSITGSENGGQARFLYLLGSSYGMNVALSGYGIGDYGAGPWGLSSGATAVGKMRQWTGDAWGSDLVCCYTGGPIYQWTPPPANVLPSFRADPATVLVNAPQQVTTLFVHSASEILVACGCEVGDVFDPLLVRWSDQDNLAIWTAASGNQAGSKRLKSGSRIVGAMMVSQGGLIWTDIGLWSMQYIGYPDVFGITPVGDNCGLLAMRCAGVLNSSVYWLGNKNFYAASPGGAPYPLECTVWDFVFSSESDTSINPAQLEECFCAVNSLFNEVWWFFPSANSSTVDSYVKYNTIEKTWDFGYLPRSCWDEGLVLGAPVGCDAMGFIQQHEVDEDANGAPLAYSFTTGFFDIAEGEEFVTVGQIWPDFKESAGASVQITISFVDFPDQPPRVYGPYTMVQGSKQFIAVNGRGRMMQLTFSGNDVGSTVRLGRVRYTVAPAGRRGGG